MPVTLDSVEYEIFQTNYAHPQVKIGATDRGLTGLPIRIESGFFDNSYNLTLLIDTISLASLRASYAKVDASGTPPGNLLDFTDEEGTFWNKNSSGGGIVNTGVYMTSMSEPKPLSISQGWTGGQRFTTTIILVVNASGLSSA